MKHGLSHTLALIALALATFAVTPVHAQTTGVGPYYATPSWDQTLPSNMRFIVLSNFNSQAVLDRETGLVWEKVPSTTPSNWFDASFHCINLNTGGRTGWHLPTIQELLSVVDRSQSNPALPVGHPFTVQSATYWAATTDARSADLAWLVNFDVGFVDSDGKSGAVKRAWCVRGREGADPQ